MPNRKEANSQKDSKAAAGSTQPNVVIPTIQRPSIILKEQDAAQKAQAMRREQQVQSLLYVIDSFMNDVGLETPVATLHRLVFCLLDNQHQEDGYLPDFVAQMVDDVNRVIQLLIGIQVNRDTKVLPEAI
jgi:hypothetical protein